MKQNKVILESKLVGFGENVNFIENINGPSRMLYLQGESGNNVVKVIDITMSNALKEGQDIICKGYVSTQTLNPIIINEILIKVVYENKECD